MGACVSIKRREDRLGPPAQLVGSLQGGQELGRAQDALGTVLWGQARRDLQIPRDGEELASSLADGKEGA